MANDKVIYREKYRNGGMFLAAGFTPVCRHHTQGFDLYRAKITEAGACLHEGKKVEYQVLKIYFIKRGE